jgi:hypothetical protein
MKAAIPVVLLLLAAALFAAPGDLVRAPEPAVRLEVGALSLEPLRPLRPDMERILLGGVLQRCSDCHALFDSLADTDPNRRQHTDVQLDHGLNDRCLNCHARTARNRLELTGGRQVGFDQSEQLCAKCHGTTYRDWERGMHGRTNGYWDKDLGQQTRLVCIECHDPHAPAVGKLVPLPGPRSWRAETPDTHGRRAGGALGRWAERRREAARILGDRNDG